MKFIIIGLGNFGSSLANKLTASGHEVIGVDNNMSKVELLKEKIAFTICLDSTDPQAVSHLPLKDADVVMVCIGENQGANIMSTALMKRMQVKRLVGRALSPLHETVLEAMGVDEIVHPEEETAERWAKRLIVNSRCSHYEISGDYTIVEAKVPKAYRGKTLAEAALDKKYQILLLTTIKPREAKNELGIVRNVGKVEGIATPKTVLKEGEIMVMYGHVQDIEEFLKEGNGED